MDATVATGAAAMMAIRVLLDHDVPEENILIVSLLMAESGTFHFFWFVLENTDGGFCHLLDKEASLFEKIIFCNSLWKFSSDFPKSLKLPQNSSEIFCVQFPQRFRFSLHFSRISQLIIRFPQN